MLMRAPGLSPPFGGLRTAERLIDSGAGVCVAIIKEMKEDPLPARVPTDREREPDGRLAEARQTLEELTEAEGADALAPAERLADLLEELLEGREGERS